MSTSSCVNTVLSNTVPLSFQTLNVNSVPLCQHCTGHHFYITPLCQYRTTVSILYYHVNNVPSCLHYTIMSTLYRCIHVVPSCQHCTAVSTLYHCVNIVLLCQYCTTVSIYYYCVNILLLYISILYYQVNIVPKSLCQHYTMLTEAIWIEC